MPFNTRAVPQLLDNIKEAKEVLAASLARGDADPDAESLEQKASEAKTEEQEKKAEKPKPQVGRPRPPPLCVWSKQPTLPYQVPTPAMTPALTPKSKATPQSVPLDLNFKPPKSLVPLKRGNDKVTTHLSLSQHNKIQRTVIIQMEM